jgi:DNA-binding MarR family transcriptional regulator
VIHKVQCEGKQVNTSNVAGIVCGRNDAIGLYVAHVHEGRSLRSLARETGLNPSTVMRRVRKVEDRRDDPLVDDFFDTAFQRSCDLSDVGKDKETMARIKQHTEAMAKTDQEEVRVLRRMCEAGTFLAIGTDLPKGAIFRTETKGSPTRVAVVNREIAKSLALREWIKLTKNDVVSVYHVTDVGRAALRRELSEAEDFGDQHRDWGERTVHDGPANDARKLRVNLRESPLAMLARKRDSNGKPFISRELLDAGERLREDFELSQLGPRVAQNWDRFINGGDRGAFGDNVGEGSTAAQLRMNGALGALGSGLGDIALRCCCFLEGLEAAEKRMGWSARSGKIVLRIALQRLRLHYDELGRHGGDYIG